LSRIELSRAKKAKKTRSRKGRTYRIEVTGYPSSIRKIMVKNK